MKNFGILVILTISLVISSIGILSADFGDPDKRICDDWVYTHVNQSGSGDCPAPNCLCALQGNWSHEKEWVDCKEDMDTSCPTECMGDSFNCFDEWICDECPECYFYNSWMSEDCQVCSDNPVP